MTKFKKPHTTCPICKCTVMVRNHKTLKQSLVRALALADHVKTLHPSATK